MQRGTLTRTQEMPMLSKQDEVPGLSWGAETAKVGKSAKEDRE